MRTTWSVVPLVRMEGVGMAMMPTEPEMTAVHAKAAPLRSGEMGPGWRSGISRVLCTYQLHHSEKDILFFDLRTCLFIYRDNCITLIGTILEAVLLILWEKPNLHMYFASPLASRSFSMKSSRKILCNSLQRAYRSLLVLRQCSVCLLLGTVH
jgi:hypothetical protein